MPRHLPKILLGASLALVGACKNPAADAPKAAVADSKPAPEAAAKAAAAPAEAAKPAAQEGQEKLAISNEQSKVLFVGSKVTGSHEGGFNKFNGTFHFDANNVEASRIEVDIDMDSVWSDSDRLTGHLKSGDFFLVEEHPTAKFVSTAIKAGGEDGATHTITGDLTLRGVTKSITFPATLAIADEAVTAKAEFALPRKQFGIVYEGKADDLIRDDVLIKLDITAPRAAAPAQAAAAE